MMNDEMIEYIIRQEEREAIGYCGDNSEIQIKRALIIDYYNKRPYGDEKEGQSSYVSSDVFDVLEGSLPPLIRFFTQARYIAKFRAGSEQYNEEAEEKTIYIQKMYEKSGGVAMLESMLRDGLSQFSGWVKASFETQTKTKFEIIRDLSPFELELKKQDKSLNIVEEEEDEDGFTTIRIETKYEESCPVMENLPADEVLISKHDRDLKTPRFIGQRTPKSRSELIQMGFDKDIVKELSDKRRYESPVSRAREHDMNVSDSTVRDYHDSQTELMLGEYYTYLDVSENGVGELYQVFFCGDKLLKKTRVEKHPYHMFCSIPLPHRVIGSCIAEVVAPIQFWRSHLIRQMNNNIYFTNFNRTIVNELVNLDDVLSPRPGGVIRIEGQMPVQQAMMPFVTQGQVPEILSAIQYADQQREQSSGITSYNQGMDTESLNKTATGFSGIRDMSMMRIEKYARHAAQTLKGIFENVIQDAMKYSDENSIVVMNAKGEPIDPTKWQDNNYICDVDIGVGAGDKQEMIANLNYVLEKQLQFMQFGSLMADEKKVYNTLDKLIFYSNLNDILPYFNNPEKPEEQLQAENQQLAAEVQKLDAQVQERNMLAEAEKVKQETEIVKAQLKRQEKQMDLDQKDRFKAAELNQKDDHFEVEKNIDITRLEIEAKKDYEGGLNAE